MGRVKADKIAKQPGRAGHRRGTKKGLQVSCLQAMASLVGIDITRGHMLTSQLHHALHYVFDSSKT